MDTRNPCQEKIATYIRQWEHEWSFLLCDTLDISNFYFILFYFSDFIGISFSFFFFFWMMKKYMTL